MSRTGHETVACVTSFALGVQAIGPGAFERDASTIVGGVVVLSALAVVAYRALGRGSTERDAPAELEAGSDRDDGIDVEDLPERCIQFMNAPSTYVGAVLSTLLLGTVLEAAGYRTGFVLALYGPGLFGLMGLLKFGWPHVERFYERRGTVERPPGSIRYEGVSTDTKVFLTLTLLCFLVLLLAILATTAL